MRDRAKIPAAVVFNRAAASLLCTVRGNLTEASVA